MTDDLRSWMVSVAMQIEAYAQNHKRQYPETWPAPITRLTQMDKHGLPRMIRAVPLHPDGDGLTQGAEA